MAMDLRELSFQNVLDTILKPAGVKVGGFPEEIFLSLSECDTETLTCSICYLIVKDSHECDNKHQFCHTCIFAWTLTFGENSEKCPVCRCEQNNTYKPNKQTDKTVGEKRVKCPEKDCEFVAPLKIFLMHSHGKKSFSNSHVELESLRPAQQRGERLLLIPLLNGGATRAERGMTIRQQLQQGRVMIHQMMLLLHMEMQLRQQALVGYTQAQDPTVRLQRLDEVLALNEQLNEVGGILSALLNTPLNRLSSAVRDRPNRQQQTSAAGGGSSEATEAPQASNARATAGGSQSLPRSSGLSLPRPRTLVTMPLDDDDGDDNDDDDDDDDDDSSDTSSEASTMVTSRATGRFELGSTPRPSQTVSNARPQSRSSSIPRPTQPTLLAGRQSILPSSPATLVGGTQSLRSMTQPPSVPTQAETTAQTPEAPRATQRTLVTRARTPGLTRRTSEESGSATSTTTTVHDLGNGSSREEASSTRGTASLPQLSNNSHGSLTGRIQPSRQSSQSVDEPEQPSAVLPSGSSAHQRALLSVRPPGRPTSVSTSTRGSASEGPSNLQSGTSGTRIQASLSNGGSNTFASDNAVHRSQIITNTQNSSRSDQETPQSTPRRPAQPTRASPPSRPLGASVLRRSDSTNGVPPAANQDRGAFVPNPTPPTQGARRGDNSSTVLTSGASATVTGASKSSTPAVPNSVVRQRTQLNPRAVVRARRAPLPRGSSVGGIGTAPNQVPTSPAQSTRITTSSRGSTSTSNSVRSPALNRNPTTPKQPSILQTSGALVTTQEPEPSASLPPRRRPSQAKAATGTNSGSGTAAGQIPRPRRRSEIAQELRQCLRKDL